jgi:hypothetical protein
MRKTTSVALGGDMLRMPMTAPPMAPMEATKTPLHDSLGVSPEYTRREYMKIVNQDEHLPTKLKALAPLAREIGLEPNPEISNATQNIIIMMPPEIAQKHQLVTDI